MNESKTKTTRVQMELPEKSMQRLRALTIKTEAASHSEVMRNALRLYEAMINRSEAGDIIMARRPNGELVEMVIF